MGRLIIIRGNSGSGKTTIAKRMQRELGYETMLISQDVIRREILRVKDTVQNPAIQLIHDLAMYGHAIGYDAIIEGILPHEKYGEMLRDLAGRFEQTYVFYLDIPFDETLRRHATKPNAADFGEEQMREWYKEKDFLGLPRETIFDHAMTEDEIVHAIRNTVG